MRYRATTQVKVLSPEILVVPAAEAFPYAAGNILVTVMGSSLFHVGKLKSSLPAMR